MIWLKIAFFLEVLLHLMIAGTVCAVIYGVIYGTFEIIERKAADPILYDDDNRALDFLAEAELESWNM